MKQTFNKIVDIIYTARKDGVEFVLNGDKLQLRYAEKKTIDKELLQEIKDNKLEIIDFLRNDSWKTRAVNGAPKLIGAFDRNDVSQIPLSFAQERLWFIDKLQGSIQYHTVVALRLKGNLSRQALEHALERLIERHQVLRTVYYELEGVVYQKIKEATEWKLSWDDGLFGNADNHVLERKINELISQPFHLDRDYMFRATLLALDDNEFLLVAVVHHIACDAWSAPIIVKEVADFYSRFTKGETAPFASLRLQFADYAVWERAHHTKDYLQPKIDYWKQKLDGFSPLQLPYDFDAPVVRSAKGDSISYKIDAEVVAKLNDICRQNDCSLYMLLLAAYNILLYRYSNQTDITVGASVANRNQAEIEELVGFFVNTVVFRNQIESNRSFIDLLNQVKATTIGAYENQDVPFEKVVENVLKERESSKASLFQVMLVFLNTPGGDRKALGELEITGEPVRSSVSKFDFTFFIAETLPGLSITVEYSTELFKEATIFQLLQHFDKLLQEITIDPNRSVSSLPMLTDKQRHKLVNDYGFSSVALPAENNIVSLFENEVRKKPGIAAVKFEGEKMTYGQLNKRVNQVAHYLRSKGIGPDKYVPIIAEPGLDLVVGILGILKSGGAYVPIDTALPAERIGFITKDTGASIVLVTPKQRHKIEVSDFSSLIVLQTDEAAFETQPGTDPEPVINNDHLAYVIYTSGSTGTPKGVMITHRCLVDYFYGIADKLPVKLCNSFALLSSAATDLGNTVIYSAFLTGGCLHLFSAETLSDAYALHSYFDEHSIDCIKIVPSHWNALEIEEKKLLPNNLLIFGGEVLYTDSVKNILSANPNLTVVNHYGPTETTIGKLLHVLDRNAVYGNTIPLGRPFGNTSVYVLSNDMKLSPVGVPGKLFIAGQGLAKGYLNNEALTNEKFVSNPIDGNKYDIVYNTGDIVKYLPDGNILFINRADDQVKIRGYRVEPGEVEAAFQSIDSIRQAVAIIKEDSSRNKNLVVFAVPDKAFDHEEVLNIIKAKLPDYMIPAKIVELESFPLMPNGKVDRRALQFIDIKSTGKSNNVNPRNNTEAKLVEIWMEVLELDNVGINDDFFEQGGHSLLAIRVVSAIRKAFKVELPIGDIFDFPTIALLSAQVEARNENELLTSIKAITPRPDYVPLSFSQERLWFIHQLGGSAQYHIPAVFKLAGSLDVNVLKNAFHQVIERHEALRTVFITKNDLPGQYLKKSEDWQLSIIAKEIAIKKQEEIIASMVNEPFDLEKDFMIRACVLELDKPEFLLVINLHHIASDAWSSSLFVKEITEIYNAQFEGRAPVLPILPVQYADYSIWQREQAKSESWKKKIEFWKNYLQQIDVLQLPADFVRPMVQSLNGAMLPVAVNSELAHQVRKLNMRPGTTMYMTLLGAFNLLLYKYTNQTDICVGTPVAGRQMQEIESLIGFFINTVVVRTRINEQETFSDLLYNVRENTLSMTPYHDIPFEKVVEATVSERDISRNPIFQVAFSYQSIGEGDTGHLKNITLKPFNSKGTEHKTSKFDITFNITESQNNLFLSVEYCTDLFKEETIQRMIANYIQLLSVVCKNSDIPLNQISVITPAEQDQLNRLNDTYRDIPSDLGLVQLFKQRIAAAPETIAIVDNHTKVTYRQLDERSNQVANQLSTGGIKEGASIALIANRGIDMIVAIWGIIKLGCTYVPLNIDFPTERLQFIVENANAAAVVCTDASLLQTKTITGCKTFCVAGAETFERSFEPKAYLPQTPVYIMFTSGTTGKPKGIKVSQQNIVNLACQQNEIRVRQNDVLLQWSDYGFDGSIYEIFGAHLNGASLCLLQEGMAANVEAMAKVIIDNKVSVCFITTAIFNAIADTDPFILKGLRKVLFGGEAVSSFHVRKVIGIIGADKIVHVYGPTETTVYATSCPLNQVNENEIIPIGRPLNNVKAFVLDQNKNPVPIGAPGELYIGGKGVSMGYSNNEALTGEKFLSLFIVNSIERLYKTGDIVRWNSNGLLEFMGRIDDQVKIRGYRIEPSEIGNVLQDNVMVQSAFVNVRNYRGFKSLVAYVIPGANFERPKLINWLKSKVPDFMVPAYWVEMEGFPLTANGKIDKNALPEPAMDERDARKLEAPSTDLERKLADMWQSLLGIKNIGVNDNFFEIGADSILTIQFANLARRNNIEIQPRDIFVYQSISQLAVFIAENAGVKINGEQELLTGNAGLLPVQQWFFENTGPAVSHFNQALILGIEKQITPDQLNRAWSLLIKQHDALRFVYSKSNGNWSQEYSNQLPAVIVENIETGDEAALRTKLLERSNYFQQSLDIFKGQIIKVVLFQTPGFESRNRLLAVVHHLAIDAVSWRILIENLEYILSAIVKGDEPDLGSKGSSYRQWHQALVKYGQQPAVKREVEYWKEEQKKYRPIQKGKTTIGRVRIGDIRSLSMNLSSEQTSILVNEVPKVYQTEINDVLLTGLALAIKQWGGISDVTIGMEGYGRNEIDKEIDLSRTVGWFTTIYPVVIETGDHSLPASLLPVVKNVLRNLPAKGIGFGVLKYINKDERLADVPKWNVVFNYLGQLDSVTRSGQWISATTDSAGKSIGDEHFVQEDLSLNGSIQNGQLFFNIGYNSKNFSQSDTEDFVSKFQAILEELISAVALEKIKFEADKTTSSFAAANPLEEIIEEDLIKSAKNKYLIPLKAAGKKSPLYIVAGGGGTATKFMRFARMLDEEQPVYALQPPIDYDDLKAFPDTIEKIAEVFVAEILSVDPDGPFALSGHCTGGKIAFEMAKQLKAAGKEVSMLAMFDTLIGRKFVDEKPSLKNYYKIPATFKSIIASVKLKIDFETYLLRKHTKKAILYKLNSLQNFFKHHFGKRSNNDLKTYDEYEIFFKTSEHYTKASRKYQMAPYDDAIILFYAKERYYFVDVNNKINFKKIDLDIGSQHAWEDYATKVMLYEIKGEHSNIFESIHGDEFAMILQEQLNKSSLLNK